MVNKYSDLDAFTTGFAIGDELAFRDISDVSHGTAGWVKRATLENILQVVHALTQNTSPIELDELLLMDDVSGTLAAQRVALWRLMPQVAFVSTQFDKTTDTALANVTGLSATLTAAGKYLFQLELQVSAGASGGHKYMMAGTATATTINYYVQAQTAVAAPTIGTRITDLGSTSIGVTSATAGICKITGGIVVNAGGTLTVQFAQNASNGTASSVLIGSWMKVIRVA